MKKQIIASILLTFFSSMCLAHSAHDLTTAYMGFMHTVTGFDHLLIMLAVGIMAARISKPDHILLLSTFAGFMLLGISLGVFGISFSALEASVAASLIIMALLTILRLSVSAKQAIMLTATFATLHGVTHGLAINGQQSYHPLFGMLSATIVLLGLGYWLGINNNAVVRSVRHILTYTMLVFGGFFLFN